MEIRHEKKGDVTVFTLIGRLDSSTSPLVEQKILEAIAGNAHDVVLDFAAVDYISSAGIRVLVHCHKELEKKGGKIFLASVTKSIENVLYITGFLPYFKVYESTNQAIDSLAKK